MIFVRMAAMALVSVAWSVVGAAHAADANAGREVFKKCAVCHRLEPNRNAMGPSLYGVVGRKAGTAPGFKYSAALKGADFEWTAELLDRWLRNPKGLVPGTKMPFAGLPNSEDRANVIEYLRQSARGPS